jgi:hypothetical protein
MVDQWFGWFEGGGGRIGSDPVRLVTVLLLFTSLVLSVSVSDSYIYNSSVYTSLSHFEADSPGLTYH